MTITRVAQPPGRCISLIPFPDGESKAQVFSDQGNRCQSWEKNSAVELGAVFMANNLFAKKCSAGRPRTIHEFAKQFQPQQNFLASFRKRPEEVGIVVVLPPLSFLAQRLEHPPGTWTTQVQFSPPSDVEQGFESGRRSLQEML